MYQEQLLFLGSLLLHLIVFGAVFIVLCDVATENLRLTPILALCAAMFLLGLIGYLAFWIGFWRYPALRFAKVLFFAWVVARSIYMASRQRVRPLLSWLGEPMLYVFLFYVAVEGLGFANGGFASPDETAQNRFSHQLPADNVIPFIFSSALRLPSVPSPLFSHWLSSDRPPLQTGIYLLLYLRDRPLPYQIIAPWLQATFLFGVWILCAAANLSTKARRLTLLACCFLPVAIINTFYTWPKMISVGYLLIVFTLLFAYRPRNVREQAIVGVLLGGAATLAALCHGSGAFAIIGMAVVVLLAWQWPSWRTVAYAIPTLLVLYLPWMAYQKFVDPPGNRLLKYHLAAVEDVDSRGFVETMRDAYGALSWDSYIAGRLSNAATMLGDPIQSLRDLGVIVFSQDTALAKDIRHVDFFNLIPSLHGYLLALILSIVLLPMIWSAWPHQRRIFLKLLGVVLVTGAICCIVLLKPGSAINHQTTYALQVMATMAAYIVLGMLVPVIGLVFVVAQIVTVGTVYGLTLPYDKGYWPILALCIATTLGLVGYTLMPFIRPSLRER